MSRQEATDLRSSRPTGDLMYCNKSLNPKMSVMDLQVLVIQDLLVPSPSRVSESLEKGDGEKV